MISAFSYISSDLDKIKFNHWGRFLKNGKSLKKIKKYLSNPMTQAFTVCDNGNPIGILAFHEYEKDSYDGCIIADACFGSKPNHVVFMRRLIITAIKTYEMKRVQTLSENDPKLNKWHEFLGFKLEKENNFEFRGVKHNLWSITWEQEQH